MLAGRFLSSLRITSTANPRVKSALRLRRRRERDRLGLTLIEGTLELEMALDAGVELVDLLVWPEGYSGGDAEIAARAERSAEARCEVSRPVAERISYGEKISPLVAVARFPEPAEPRISPANALVLVLDRIEKPGNLGAALRSADAVGVTAVFVSGSPIDLFNPNVIRASLGTVFTLPVHHLSREAAAETLGDLPIVVAT
ncbi:MAG: 23S rRNA methyltransferase, partial [Gemmatimonadetes bacterium]|nr:23S rRNA methyltransferase [Gemmatimonadota bacterium]